MTESSPTIAALPIGDVALLTNLRYAHISLRRLMRTTVTAAAAARRKRRRSRSGARDAGRHRSPFRFSLASLIARSLIALLRRPLELWDRWSLPSEAESSYARSRRDARAAHRRLLSAATAIARAGALEDIAHATSRMAVLALSVRPARMHGIERTEMAFAHALSTAIVRNAAATEHALARGVELAGPAPIRPVLVGHPATDSRSQPPDLSLWMALLIESDRRKRAAYFDLMATLLTAQVGGAIGAHAADTAYALAASERGAADLLADLQ